MNTNLNKFQFVSLLAFLSGSSDGLAKCWVTEFGDNTVTYEGHGLSVTCVKFYKGLCKFEDTFSKLTIISVITITLV